MDLGRMHLDPSVSRGSFRAGLQGTHGFLRGNSGIGTSVQFGKHTVARGRVKREILSHLTSRLASITAVRSRPGVSKEDVFLVLTPGTSGWVYGLV